MIVENFFDRCVIEDLTSSLLKTIECTNFMNDRYISTIKDISDIISCKYHLCIASINQDDSSKHVLSCSGAVLKYSSESFLNPLIDKSINIDIALPLPNGIVETISPNLKYYYVKDVRTVFKDDILSMSCSDDFLTTVKLKNGDEHMWGNIENENIFHSGISFVLGIVITISCYIVTFWFLKLWVDNMESLNKRLIKMIIFSFLIALLSLVLFHVAITELFSFIFGVIFIYIPIVILYYYKDILHPLSRHNE